MIKALSIRFLPILLACVIVFTVSAPPSQATAQNSNTTMPSPSISLTAEEQAWLDTHRVIRVGNVANIPPMIFSRGEEGPAGISIEYLKRIGEALGVRFEYVSAPDWSSGLEKFKAHKIDVMPMMAQSESRDHFTNFTKPYISVPFVIFAREEVPYIGDVDKLEGRKVVVTNRSITHILLEKEHPEIQLLPVRNAQEAIDKLKQNDAYAYISTVLTTSRLIRREQSNIKVSGHTPYKLELGMGVRKDWILFTGMMQKALDSIPGEERDLIEAKWIGLQIEHEIVPSYIWGILTVIVALLISAILVIVIFRHQLELKTRSLQETAHDLGERVKELTGLYALSSIFGHEKRNIAEILQAVTEVLPPAWHYPDIACARITYDDQTLTSSNFQKTSWCQSSDIVVANVTVGTVEVYYREQMPALFEGPFLEEERNLINDIAHRIGAYIERNKAEDDLVNEQEYSALQSKFISLVSHEFRTPLSIIDATVQRLVRSKKPITREILRNKSEKIRMAVGRMTDLIENTLYAARLEENKIKLTPVTCSLGNMIQEICSLHSYISSEHDIRVDLTDLPPTIVADEKQLNIIFTNLLSNAIKFAPGASLIKVKGWEEDGQVVVTVCDQGVGIPQDELPNMFDRFFRATTAEGIKGTGIGLSVCKEFAEMHGGSVDVDSLEGEGSTFTVRLPVDGERQLH